MRFECVDRAVTVSLSWFELFQGAQVGITRQVDNIRFNRHDRNGPVGDPWTAHILGALGELAVAGYIDRFWSGQLGDFKARDAGPLQVRATHRATDRLVLHEWDGNEQAFVLVTPGVRPADVVLRGWLYGREGKDADYWTEPVDGRPAFFVPQGELTSMDRLRQALGK